MKTTTLFIAVLLVGLLVMTGPAFAETYSYPADDPVFSISFPDNWTVERDPNYEKGLVALSEDEEIEIDLWVLEEQEVEDDLLEALEAAGREVATIIQEWVTDFEVEERTEGEVDGIRFHQLSGTGVYKDDESKVEVAVTFFSPDNERIFVLMYWGSKEAAEEHGEELESIKQSLETSE
ncbi:MAG: hypothetical protein GY801_44270 [bacterium]|nr:hypothetical protein [bacterium]